MGDWIERWHWIACPDELAALTIYDRLEHAAIDYRRNRDCALRFGFAAPRLIIAMAARKWGEDTFLLEHATRGLAVETLVSTPELAGDIDAFDLAHAFVWTPDAECDATLERAGLPAQQVGAVKVRRISRDELFVRAAPLDDVAGLPGQPAPMWRLRPLEGIDHDDELVVGVVSRTHGLVQLGCVGRHPSFTAEAMPLWASRIAGAGNWTVVRDDIHELPPTHLFDDIAWRFERHGAHVLWQSRAQRARWIRDARASTDPAERLAGALMARRWGLAKVQRPRHEIEAWWHAGPDTLVTDRLPHTPAIGRMVDALEGRAWCADTSFGDLARMLADLIARGDSRVAELASRFAELAHAVSRTSYWMVRDGAPAADLPADAAGPRPPWDGDPASVASAIEFWAWCALRASRHPDRARAAAARFVALEAAIEHTTPVWWIPPKAWIGALLHAEIAGDSDAATDPTIHETILLDAPAARRALETLLDAEAVASSTPRDAIPTYEAAHRDARAAGAPVLALRARLRLLSALLAAGEHERFTELGNELLRELPSPIVLVHYSTAGELTERALRWTANQLAWHAVGRGDHELALGLVDRALIVADQRFDAIRDTKVRALLGLGRTEEAYRIVREVLARTPDFEMLADLAADPGYRSWLATAG